MQKDTWFRARIPIDERTICFFQLMTFKIILRTPSFTRSQTYNFSSIYFICNPHIALLIEHHFLLKSFTFPFPNLKQLSVIVPSRFHVMVYLSPSPSSRFPHQPTYPPPFFPIPHTWFKVMVYLRRPCNIQNNFT